MTYYSIQIGKFTTNSKVEMMTRLANESEKIKNHYTTCQIRDKSCKFCSKIILIMNIFLEYEKKENKKVELKNLTEEIEEMIDDDDLLRVVYME